MSARHTRLAAWWLAALLGCVAVPAAADEIIPAGGYSSTGGGRVDLGCTDLYVNGTLNVPTGGSYVNVRNVTVGGGGALTGTGSISYSGVVSGPTGTVNLVPSFACGTPPVDAKPVPTLGEGMLITLAAMLLWLASLVLGDRGALRRRGNSKGAGK